MSLFVAIHALWIVGMAIVFGAFSYYDWLRRAQRTPWREVWPLPSLQLLVSAGAFMVGVSAILQSRGWGPERFLWLALTAVFAFNGGRAWMRRAAAAQPR